MSVAPPSVRRFGTRRLAACLAAGVVAWTLVASPANAAAPAKSIFRRPPLLWTLYSGAWLGASIWAQPRTDFFHSAFAYVPSIYTGLYAGALVGGRLGESGASQGDWGSPLIGMILGGVLGSAAGVGLGYAASRNVGAYYTAQGLYVSVVMFTIPLY